MIPSPDRVIACPYCQGLLRIQLPPLSNAVGMSLWSDGYLDVSNTPPLIKSTCCPHCRKFFWVDEAKEVGTVRPWEEDDSSKPGANAPYAAPLTLEQLQAVVELHRWRNEDEELHARKEWRWHVNHRYRESGSEVELTPEMETNLRRIAEIYTQKRAEIDLALAEVTWHLEEYDHALQLLENLTTPTTAATLREAIEKRDRRVIQMPLG